MGNISTLISFLLLENSFLDSVLITAFDNELITAPGFCPQ